MIAAASSTKQKQKSTRGERGISPSFSAPFNFAVPVPGIPVSPGWLRHSPFPVSDCLDNSFSTLHRCPLNALPSFYFDNNNDIIGRRYPTTAMKIVVRATSVSDKDSLQKMLSFIGRETSHYVLSRSRIVAYATICIFEGRKL